LPDNNNVAEVRFASSGMIRVSNGQALSLGNTRVTVQSGDLEFDITGGIHTGSGLLRALAGRISLIAHSPITIGSGGVQAAAGVSLAANTADSTSTISINGALNGGTGAVNLGAYSNITQNATLSGSAIAMSSTSGNIVIAASATNSVSAGGSIQLSAPQGTVASSSGNFSGAAPVIADSTPPPVIAPTNTASTEIATTLQTVMDPLPPPPPTDSVVVSASPTSVAAPEVAPAPAPTTTTPAASTNQDAAASSQPAPASAPTATNAPAAAAPSSDAATPAAGTTDAKSGDATKSAKTEEKSETKPAPKPAVQTVMVANSTVQKPADQVMQVERPKGRLLVCKG
jgi:hypothetical protein